MFGIFDNTTNRVAPDGLGFGHVYGTQHQADQICADMNAAEASRVGSESIRYTVKPM